MILDNLLKFAENVTMSVLTTTTAFPDSIDLLKAYSGAGEPMGIIVTVSGGPTTAGAGVGSFIAFSGATANAMTNEIGRKTVAGTEMLVGSRHIIPLGPLSEPTVQGRFLTVAYSASANHTGAIVSAFMQPMSMIDDKPKSFPSGYTVA